jgi:hypothetical protein
MLYFPFQKKGLHLLLDGVKEYMWEIQGVLTKEANISILNILDFNGHHISDHDDKIPSYINICIPLLLSDVVVIYNYLLKFLSF